MATYLELKGDTFISRDAEEWRAEQMTKELVDRLVADSELFRVLADGCNFPRAPEVLRFAALVAEACAKHVEEELWHAAANDMRLPPDLEDPRGVPVVRAGHVDAALRWIREVAFPMPEDQ